VRLRGCRAPWANEPEEALVERGETLLAWGFDKLDKRIEK